MADENCELVSKKATLGSDSTWATLYSPASAAAPADSASVAVSTAGQAAATQRRTQGTQKQGEFTSHQGERALLSLDCLAAGEAKSAAQLLAVGNLHKENDDCFNALTRALEQDVDYRPGSNRGSVKEGANAGCAMTQLQCCFRMLALLSRDALSYCSAKGRLDCTGGVLQATDLDTAVQVLHVCHCTTLHFLKPTVNAVTSSGSVHPFPCSIMHSLSTRLFQASGVYSLLHEVAFW